jgi:hypothetical protein
MNKLKGLCATLVVALLPGLLGCANQRAARKPSLHDRPAAERRLTDTPAERLAAMPVPDPAAAPENKDQRFGLESDKHRRETEARKRAEKQRCVDVVSDKDAKKRQPPCPPGK